MDEKLKRIKGKKNGNSFRQLSWSIRPAQNTCFLVNNETVFDKRRNKHSNRFSVKIPGHKLETY